MAAFRSKPIGREENTHAAIVQYLKWVYPKAIFNTDLSGIILTKGQAAKVSSLRSSRGFPDLVIYECRGDYSGLFLEVKRDGTKIYRKDGELVADEHVREQAEMLVQLESRGYCARFAVGFSAAREIIDWYMDL